MEGTAAISDEDKHHPPLSISIDIKTSLTIQCAPTYVFKKADYVELNRFFLRTNWIELYELESLDGKVRCFYSKINEAIAQFVPVHTNEISNYPCWFSKKLINKIKLKKEAHANYKKSRSKASCNNFRKLRLA